MPETYKQYGLMTGWMRYFAYGRGDDVVPCGDLRDHEPGATCWCHPTEDEGVFVHHAMDQRELYETGKRRLS